MDLKEAVEPDTPHTLCVRQELMKYTKSRGRIRGKEEKQIQVDEQSQIPAKDKTQTPVPLGDQKLRLLQAKADKQKRCHLDLPRLPLDLIDLQVSKSVNQISSEQWICLMDNEFSPDVVDILSNMCHEIIFKISTSILQAVKPQVVNHQHSRIAQDSDSSSDDTSSSSSSSETLQDGCRHCRVTEKAVQASIGNIFHHCFGKAMGIVQQKTHHPKILVAMFADVITKEVNSFLTLITSSAPQDYLSSHPVENEIQMVYHVAAILKRCILFLQMQQQQSEKSEESEDKMKIPTNVARAKKSRTSFQSESRDSLHPTATPLHQQSSKGSDHLTEKRKMQETTFVCMILAKLLRYIAKQTHSSVLDIDFDRIRLRVLERTVGQLPSKLPKSFKHLCKDIYKELCQSFGGKYLMQAALEFADVAFEDEVAAILKAVLKKNNEKKNKKIAGITISINKKANGKEQDEDSAPSSSPATFGGRIRRGFSCVARVLRNTFLSYTITIETE